MTPPGGALPTPMRGQVWYVEVPEQDDNKRYLVVSNNHRNQSAMDSVLAIPIGGSPNLPDIAEIVKLSQSDPMGGSARCNLVASIPKARFRSQIAALTPQTMERVAAGLRATMNL